MAARTWSSPRQVFNRGRNFGLMKYPRMAANGDSLFVSCRVADYDNSYLLSFRSLDGGLTWGDSAVADPLTWGLDQGHSMVFSWGRIHIVYPLHFEGSDIFHTMSTDGGLSWIPRERLSTQDGWAGQSPSAHADSSGNVIAAWFDYKYGSMCGVTGDILTRTSTDNGDSWLPEGRVINTQSGNASACFVLGGTVHVVWGDEFPFGCGHPKIMHSLSGDWGQSWSPSTLISGEFSSSDRSTAIIAATSGDTTILHCFWDRRADGFAHLYYIQGRYLSTGIDGQDGAGLPEGMSLTAYPNPFNSSVNIVCDLGSEKGGEIAIYSIQGQLVRSFRVEGKEGKINWDAADAGGKKVCSGLYFAKARTPQNSSTIRLYLIK